MPKKPAAATAARSAARPAEKPGLHPRNKHSGRYDFAQLIAASPELAAFVAPNAYGDESIDFADPHDAAGARLRHAFGAPRTVWAAHALHEVRAVLDAAEAAARGGAWVLGWLRYEAAPAFDPALAVQAGDPALPLAWFAAHDAPLPWPTAATAADDARILDARAFAEVVLRDLLERQEAVPVLAIVDETGLE